MDINPVAEDIPVITRTAKLNRLVDVAIPPAPPKMAVKTTEQLRVTVIDPAKAVLDWTPPVLSKMILSSTPLIRMSRPYCGPRRLCRHALIGPGIA